MANMSYCRFENTLRDLTDCKLALETRYDVLADEVLSDSEESAKKRILQTCINILNLAVEAKDPDLDKDDLHWLAVNIKEFLR